MDEAERLCDRVAIVDHGKVIALGTPRELIASLGGEHVIEFDARPEWPRPASDAGRWPMLPTVSDGARRGRPASRLTVAEPHVVLPALLDLTRELGVPADQSDHAACQPRRRVRQAHRPAPGRRGGGPTMKTDHRAVTTGGVLAAARDRAGPPARVLSRAGGRVLGLRLPDPVDGGLGIAFRNQPIEKIAVDVEEGPRAEAIAKA